MPWREASFKGKQVFIEVDGTGSPRISGGRVSMRYSEAAGAKLYRAGSTGIGAPRGPVLDLPAGVDADSAPASGASRGSGFGSAGTRTAEQAGLAADAAKRLLAGLAPGTAVAYTDGACKGNPGPAGAGAVVKLPDGRIAELSLALGTATNNVGELSAIGLALDALDEAGWPASGPVALLTDSSYAHGVLCKAWKAKANAELIAGLRARLQRRPGVAIHWVAGHAGIAGNERADELAGCGVKGLTAKRWITA